MGGVLHHPSRVRVKAVIANFKIQLIQIPTSYIEAKHIQSSKLSLDEGRNSYATSVPQMYSNPESTKIEKANEPRDQSLWLSLPLSS